MIGRADPFVAGAIELSGLVFQNRLHYTRWTLKILYVILSIVALAIVALLAFSALKTLPQSGLNIGRFIQNVADKSEILYVPLLFTLWESVRTEAKRAKASLKQHMESLERFNRQDPSCFQANASEG